MPAYHKWIPQFKLVNAPSNMPETSLSCKIAIGCTPERAQRYNRCQMKVVEQNVTVENFGHRLAKVLGIEGANVTITKQVVMHICDRGARSKEADGSPSIGVCCERSHLRLGTNQENIKDCANKHRLNTTGFKLTKEQRSKNGKRLSSIINNIVRTCPYCNLVGKGPVMIRFHFKNCKQKFTS